MALNIGNINFGVDADTRGLQKAVAQIEKFRRVVDATSRSQSEGAKKRESALARQESQMKKAFQQAVNLQQQFRKFEGTSGNIANVTRALNRHIKELQSGQLTYKEFIRTVDAFNGKLGRSRRELNALRSNAKNAAGAGKGLNVILRDLESASVLALGPLSGLGARIRSFGAIATRTSSIITIGLVVGITAAATAFGLLSRSIIRTERELEKMEARFRLGTGSAEAAAMEMQFVFQTAQKLGVEVQSLGRAYSRLTAATAGTSLAGQQTREIFLALSEASAALRLDTADTEGIFRAFEQIISKGTVQAEELRGQLGDRLPGAFRLAAQAMGVTTRELGVMLKTGEVLAEDLIPKLVALIRSEVGETAAQNVNTLAGATNRLSNAWTLWLDNLNDTLHISAAWISLMNQVTGLLEATGGAVAEVSEETEQWNRMLQNLKTEPAIKITKAFEDLADDLKDVVREHDTLTAVLLDLSRPEILQGPEELRRAYERLFEIGQLNPDELGALARLLSKELGVSVLPTVLSVSDAFNELETRVENMNDTLERAAERAARQSEGLADVGMQIRNLNTEIAALRQGPAGEDVFDDILKPMQKFKDSLMEMELPLETRNQLEAVFNQLLKERASLEQAARDQEDTERDRARDAERAQKAIVKGVEATARLRERIKALSEGTGSLRIFEQIQEPLMRYEEQLRTAKVSEEAINVLLEQRRELLTQLFTMQDQVNQAAQSAAQAIGNSLERIIVKGETAADVLRDLARELFRVFLRATFLDPLIQGLTDIFSGGFRSAGIGTQTGAKFDLGPQAATGSAAGGARRPFQNLLVGEQGPELLTLGASSAMVTPNRKMGGGDVNVTINAPGADAGTVERIREMVRTELAPQIIQASTDNTFARLRRPRFA